jgi:hypothetical protein
MQTTAQITVTILDSNNAVLHHLTTAVDAPRFPILPPDGAIVDWQVPPTGAIVRAVVSGITYQVNWDTQNNIQTLVHIRATRL